MEVATNHLSIYGNTHMLHHLDIGIFLTQNARAASAQLEAFPWTPWWVEALWRMAFQWQPGATELHDFMDLLEKWEMLAPIGGKEFATGDWWLTGEQVGYQLTNLVIWRYLDVDSFGQLCATCRTQSIQLCAMPIRDHRNQSPPVVNHRPLGPIEESRSENHASDRAQGNLSTRNRDQIVPVNGKVTLNSFHVQRKTQCATSEDSFRYATRLSQALWVNHILVDEPGHYLAWSSHWGPENT